MNLPQSLVFVLALPLACFSEFFVDSAHAQNSGSGTPVVGSSGVIGSSGVQVGEYERTNAPIATVKEEISKQKEVIDNLLTLLNEGDANAKIEAHYLLLHAAQPKLSSYLVERLKKGNRVNTQVALLDAIAQIGDASLAKQLLFELTHGEEPSKLAVIAALGKIGGDAMVPELFEILVGSAKRTAQMEEEAALALGDIGTPKATYALEAAKARLDKKSGGGGTDVGGPLPRIVDWSIQKAQGAFDTPVTDDSVPKGQNARLKFKGMAYYFYRPPFDARKSEKPWMLICIHDKEYDARATYEQCRTIAGDNRIAVLVPVFDPIRFRNFEELNYRGLRADSTLIELIDFLGEHASVIARESYLWGARQGGSFVQRYAYLHPDRVARAAFFTENFTRIDEEQYFPIGLKPSPFSPAMKFDPSKIAKLDIAYYWTQRNAAVMLMNPFPAYVEQFRAYSRELETLPRLTYFKMDIFDGPRVGNWLFDTLNREKDGAEGKR